MNCAAIPDIMLEAELFGFEPGAFTDAKRAKPGLFEAASGGTLFLDEIDALPLDGRVALEAQQRRAGDFTRVSPYTVVGVSPWRESWARRRCLTRSPFEGREREVILLDAIFQQVMASRGQIVSLVGAPGMGKSRLLEEYCQRYLGPRVRYAEGHCLA